MLLHFYRKFSFSFDNMLFSFVLRGAIQHHSTFQKNVTLLTRGANDLSEKLIWVAARMSFKIFIQFCLAKLVHFCLGGATLHPLPPNCGQVLRCQYQSPYRPNGGAASPDTRLSEKQEKAKIPGQLSFR